MENSAARLDQALAELVEASHLASLLARRRCEYQLASHLTAYGQSIDWYRRELTDEKFPVLSGEPTADGAREDPELPF